MKRRGPSEEGLPPYLAEMQPDRYLPLAERHLEGHPGDTLGAAMAVWRAFCGERRDWMRDHQRRRWVDGRDTLGTPRPPVAWVRLTFGTPAPRERW